MLNDFIKAVQFLTILPLPSAKDSQPQTLVRSMLFFPWVGLLIAAISWALFLVFESFLPTRIAVLVLVIAPILLSGGLHIDAFADFCDGFFGGKNKEDVLRIMKDPRLGTWGSLGLVLLILVKFELLLVLTPQFSFFAMALVASRWAQVGLSYWLPYAGPGGGISESFAQKVGLREMLGATLGLAPFLLGIFPQAMFILTGLIVFLCLLGLAFKKRLGGVTGDLLGASSELTEVFVFISAIVLRGHGK